MFEISQRVEQAVTEGFLDVIKTVMADINRAKKSDPSSWKRAWTSTSSLIKILKNTYCNEDWLQKQGAVSSETVSMSDMAPRLLVKGEVPTNIAEALDTHVFTTQLIMKHWEMACQERSDLILRALQQIYFDPNNVGAWPFYANKLTLLLHNLKPPRLLNTYHSFDGLLGSIVVLKDGHLSIGSHISHPKPFPTLTLEEIPTIAQSVINALTYVLNFSELTYSPSVLWQSVRVPNGGHNADGSATYNYVTFMEYLHEHNEFLAHIIDGEHLSEEAFDESPESNHHLNVMMISDGDYRDSFQPYHELHASLERVCEAVEYWMHRSVK